MGWLKRLGNLTRSARVSRDIERELEFHLAERADELMAGGMGEAEARREARRRFGSPTALKERTRDADLLTWLESVGADLRYAARALRAAPSFTAVAVLSLALGIGANTAIFSLVNAVVLRSLPVQRPERLVQLRMGEYGDHFTNPLWEAIRDRPHGLAGVFAYGDASFDLANGGEVRRVAGNWVSGSFFATLGVRPSAGRLLAPADDFRGCPATAVVSDGFWRRELGGDPAAVGRTLSLYGRPFQIVGVAAPEFFGVDVGRSADVYAPICAQQVLLGERHTLDHRSNWWLRIAGRLGDGVTPEAAGARLAAMAPAVFAATVPPRYAADVKRQYLARTLGVRAAAGGASELRSHYAKALGVLLAVAALVLLVACANVANLLLARAAAREREIATRLAIGAGRGRLVRQLLTESLLLSAAGAALGLLIARWASGLLVRFLSTRGNAVWLDLSLDGRVLAFTAAVATATGVLFGLAPAWRASRAQPMLVMRGARGAVNAQGSTAKWLVAAQVALSLMLVTAAGLLLGSFRRLATMDPGFRAEGVLLVAASARDDRPRPAERQRADRHAMLERLRALPGVRAASASYLTPIQGGGWNDLVAVDGYAPLGQADSLVNFNAVSDQYFAAMGTALVAGRDLSARDTPEGPKVAVVNEEMARKMFGGASPIGRTYRLRAGDELRPPVEIVGVVRDAKYWSLRDAPAPAVYLPIDQSEMGGFGTTFALRTDGRAPADLVPAVKAAIAAVDPAVSLEFNTLATQVAESLTRERLLAALSGFFGGLALLLAVVGLYGTTAYGVARRSSEIGIRIALGAARAHVVRMVMGEVGFIVGAGVLLGAAGAVAAARLVASFLYGVTPTDPATLLLSALVLAGAAAVAGLIPAWRASRADPVEALRNE